MCEAKLEAVRLKAWHIKVKSHISRLNTEKWLQQRSIDCGGLLPATRTLSHPLLVLESQALGPGHALISLLPWSLCALTEPPHTSLQVQSPQSSRVMRLTAGVVRGSLARSFSSFSPERVRGRMAGEAVGERRVASLKVLFL